MSWKITDGSYKSVSFHVATPKFKSGAGYGITSQEIVTERRLQSSENPLVAGGKIEDFERKPRTFAVEIVFFGEDYSVPLKAFEDVLNDGKSGLLILPDLSEAVYAKFQRCSRKTVAGEGRATILSVSWIEDNSQQNLLAASTTIPKNSPKGFAALIANVNSTGAKVQAFAASVTDTLNNNAVVNTIKQAQSAVTTARVTINSVTNVARNLREQILNTVISVQNDISGLKDSVNGILHFTDNLSINLNKKSPTQYNTGLGLVDYKQVGTGTTSTVATGTQVVTNPATITPVQSFEDAKKQLEALVTTLTVNHEALKTQTQGATVDVSQATVLLLNSAKDLIALLDNSPTTKILTNTKTSLLEVCFENGKTVDEIDDVYALNRHINDPLCVDAFTVINL